MPHAFISYRRSDSAQAARALHFQLRLRFGSSQVFMDVSAINPGDVWPDRLKRALDQATVVLAVIGPQWLTAADRYGRRRLDDPADWVHRELQMALAAGKQIVPLRVGQLQQLPPAEALPAALAALPLQQDLELRDAHWDHDVQHLCQRLSRDLGFVEMDSAVLMPDPEVKVAPLTPDQLDQALQHLPRWEPVESMIVRDYPNTRHELRRAFRFPSFKAAMRFLADLVAPMTALQHHPRIENQWRTVVIYFSTWDIGHKITALDVDAALAVDRVYAQIGDPPSA